MKTLTTMRPTLSYLLAGLVLTTLTGCVRLYSAERIDATVLDGATGLPIAGVVVVAHWQTETHTLGGRMPGNQVQIAEAKTDAKGRLQIPAWGPKLVLRGAIEEKTPQLLLFKSGYLPLRIADENRPSPDTSWTRTSAWIPERLTLVPFPGTKREYADALFDLHSTLDGVIKQSDGTCGWREMLSMLRALERQEALFDKERIPSSGLVSTLRANESLYAKRGCGSVNELLKGG
jgi:hypothetical protein